MTRVKNRRATPTVWKIAATLAFLATVTLVGAQDLAAHGTCQQV